MWNREALGVPLRAGGPQRPAAGAFPGNELFRPVTFSSHAQLLRCRGRKEQVAGFIQGWDLSDGWGKQGSRSLLGIGKNVAKMANKGT